jgi:hypothetical protein
MGVADQSLILHETPYHGVDRGEFEVPRSNTARSMAVCPS